MSSFWSPIFSPPNPFSFVYGGFVFSQGWASSLPRFSFFNFFDGNFRTRLVRFPFGRPRAGWGPLRVRRGGVPDDAGPPI